MIITCFLQFSRASVAQPGMCVCVLNEYSTWHLGGPKKKKTVAIKTQVRLPPPENLLYHYLFLHSLIFSPWLSPCIYRMWVPWGQKTSEMGRMVQDKVR